MKSNKLKMSIAICLGLGIVAVGIFKYNFLQSTLNRDLGKTEQSKYKNTVVGLLSDGKNGSTLVAYTTDDWIPTILLNLPDVTPDNYAAISADGRYIAFTTWDDGNVRRYLKLYCTNTQKTVDIFKDLPAKCEITDISWMPDNKTLLFIVNDSRIQSYQEIHTFNVETKVNNLISKGEVWKVREIAEDVPRLGAFYLKGKNKYISARNKAPDKDSDGWDYYLSQSDIDQIYQYYGGNGSYPINKILNFFYVDFSRPRISSDGNSIVYSATLKRNSATGVETPLWFCSSIWKYDIPSKASTIVYTQKDGGAIGRVDWLSDDKIAFISYYDFQGSRDVVNIFDLKSKNCSVLFSYSDVHYNNVTLLPIGNGDLTFTSSAKYKSYGDSTTIQIDPNTGKYQKINIRLNHKTVLLKNYVYTLLEEHALQNKIYK